MEVTDKLFDIISIGSAFEDLFISSSQAQLVPYDGEEADQALALPLGAKLQAEIFQREIGGGGANSAVSFSRSGWRAGLITRVGDDLAGIHIGQVLDVEHVDRTHILVESDQQTGQSVVLLAPGGDRTIIAHRGVGSTFSSDDILEEVIQQTSWVYVTSIGGHVEALRKLFGLCHLHGVRVAWNPGALELAHGKVSLAPMLQQVDVLSLNKEEAIWLLGKHEHSAEQLVEPLMTLIGQGVVMVTDGGQGAWVYDGRVALQGPAGKASVIDATGAGDAFGSGFVGAYMHGHSVEESLQFAVKNAESVIGHVGAQTGLLDARITMHA